ncbi:hypothetical protein CDAR_612711 [Caerostris darwini]|uniref:Uncharacterized protein n=1 Tax=Caerostris darwini TaxID=1538125 RepID=A0AAV4WMJ9_9ARAC|nr:hypothetical protein CDAR_612711 [Caerostris darwini]
MSVTICYFNSVPVVLDVLETGPFNAIIFSPFVFLLSLHLMTSSLGPRSEASEKTKPLPTSGPRDEASSCSTVTS